ncbi:MAG: histidine kinase [Eubacteriales bacterium]|nr:histidine kinase [Eubacteriales bacterium]
MFSLRRQIRGAILIGAVLLIVILAIQLILSIRSYGGEIDERHMDALENYATYLQSGIAQLNDAVGGIYSSNNAFQELGEKRQSAGQEWDDAYDVKVLLSQQGKANHYLSGLILFYDNYKKDLYYADSQISYSDLKTIRESLRIIGGGTDGSGVYAAGSGLAYQDGVIESERSVWYYILMQKSYAAVAGYVDLGAGLPVGEGSFGVIYESEYYSLDRVSERISVSTQMFDAGRNRVDGQIIYCCEIPALNMKVVEILPDRIDLYIDKIQILAAFLLFLLIPLAVWLYCFVNRHLVRPLDDMTEAMLRIQEGDWQIQFRSPNRIAEIENTRRAIRVMLEEIEQAKICAYEEKIVKQQIQLQYLRLQLTPHFYTNCLKNAYYMLQLGEVESAEKFLLCMSRHLRYLLQQDLSCITVQKEVEFVRNYIEMEQYLVAEPLSCNIQMETGTEEAQIPLLAIQTFVENSIKYARGTVRGELHIQISIRKLRAEDGEHLDITVRDNGPGYSTEQEKRLNHPDLMELAGKTGGIVNLQSRLRLYFAGEASWYFSSHAGAVSEIIVPFQCVGKTGRQEE